VARGHRTPAPLTFSSVSAAGDLRPGYAISPSTLGERVGTCGVRLQLLVDALRGTFRGHQILYADETPV
jgi:hypothetical protein